MAFLEREDGLGALRLVEQDLLFVVDVNGRECQHWTLAVKDRVVCAEEGECRGSLILSFFSEDTQVLLNI